MAEKHDLVFKKIAVDIGDLRVEFFGASEFLRSIDIASSPLHLHAKHEFQYIISGTMQAVVNGDQLEDISEDTVLLIPPNMLHSNPSCDGKRLIATLALQQLPGAAGDRSFSEYTYYCELFAAFREPLVFRDAAVTHYIRQILSLQDLPENEHRLKSILTMLFISLADYIKGSAQTEVGQYPFDPGSQYNQQYFLIDNYINRNYNKKVSIQELADFLHVSRRQADRIVDSIFGKTYAVLILNRRMSIAQILLQKTGMTCAQVAEKVGYGSYAGFYIAFKQHFGMAPEEMRSQAGNNDNMEK